MQYRIILSISIVTFILISVTTARGQEAPNDIFLPYISIGGSQTPVSTVAPSATASPTSVNTPTASTTDTPINTATFTPTTKPVSTPTATQIVSTSTPTATPIEPFEKLYLRWDLSSGDVVPYLDIEPHTDSIQFSNSLYPSAVVTFPYSLDGDISGNSYELSLILAIETGPLIPDAQIITFDVELLVNEQVLASTVFTATSTTAERFSQMVSGIDPSTNSGDVLILKITNISSEGVGAVRIGRPPESDSHIVIPLVVQETVEPGISPTPTNPATLTDTPTPTVTPTATPTVQPTQEVSCVPETGNWSGLTSEESHEVSFEVIADCMIRSFRIEIPSAIPGTTCVVTLTEDLPITDNQFSYKTLGLGRIEIAGEFHSNIDAVGTYSTGPLFGCPIPVKSPGEGTWQAQPN